MNVLDITGTERKNTGKKYSRQVRSNKEIPCVLYGGEETRFFIIATNEVKDIVYSADFKVANLSLNGSSYRCILKDIQFHPVTENILHMDFLELTEDKDVKVELPIRLKGTAPGVKAGGNLIQKMRKVQVKTKPRYLVEELEIDVSGLELGYSLKVRDIDSMEGIEIMSAGGIPVASVEVPRALKSLEAEAAVTEGEEGDEVAGEEEAGAPTDENADGE